MPSHVFTPRMCYVCSVRVPDAMSAFCAFIAPRYLVWPRPDCSGGPGLRLRRRLRSREVGNVDPPRRGLFSNRIFAALIWSMQYRNRGLFSNRIFAQKRTHRTRHSLTAVTGSPRTHMALTKESKTERRAKAAGPHPRPRGRTPRDADGRPKEWDRQNRGWKVAIQRRPSAPVPQTCTAALPCPADASITVVSTTNFVMPVAAAAVTWEALCLWNLTARRAALLPILCCQPEGSRAALSCRHLRWMVVVGHLHFTWAASGCNISPCWHLLMGCDAELL